jgi:hypothetical protein
VESQASTAACLAISQSTASGPPLTMAMQSPHSTRRSMNSTAAFLPSRICVNTVPMKKQTVITKKRRGPPPTGIGTLVGVRLQPAQLKPLDAYIAKQKPPMTRPQAIRILLAEALGVKKLG